MVLYIVGLGLGDEKDITIRGLECVRSCSRLYLEYYTSIIGVDVAKLEEFYGKSIIIADRNMVIVIVFIIVVVLLMLLFIIIITFIIIYNSYSYYYYYYYSYSYYIIIYNSYTYYY